MKSINKGDNMKKIILFRRCVPGRQQSITFGIGHAIPHNKVFSCKASDTYVFVIPINITYLQNIQEFWFNHKKMTTQIAQRITIMTTKGNSKVTVKQHNKSKQKTSEKWKLLHQSSNTPFHWSQLLQKCFHLQAYSIKPC